MESERTISDAQSDRIFPQTAEGVAFYNELYDYYADFPEISSDTDYEHIMSRLGKNFNDTYYDYVLRKNLDMTKDDMVRLAKAIKRLAIQGYGGLLTGFGYFFMLGRLCSEYKSYIVGHDLAEHLIDFVNFHMERPADASVSWEGSAQSVIDYINSEKGMDDFYDKTRIMYNNDMNTKPDQGKTCQLL